MKVTSYPSNQLRITYGSVLFKVNQLILTLINSLERSLAAYLLRMHLHKYIDISR